MAKLDTVETAGSEVPVATPADSVRKLNGYKIVTRYTADPVDGFHESYFVNGQQFDSMGDAVGWTSDNAR